MDYLGEVKTRNPFSMLRARAALDRLLAEEQIDVVMCHSAWAHGMFAPVVKARGLPLAHWMHTTATGRHWTEWWARRIPPAVVVCNSRHTASSARYLFPGISTQVVYYPISQHAPILDDDASTAPAVIVPGDEHLFIEALQNGSPVISTTAGPGPEFITPDCGILVAPHQPALVESALRELMKNDARWLKMSIAGPLRVAALCDPATQLERLRQVLSSTAR